MFIARTKLFWFYLFALSAIAFADDFDLPELPATKDAPEQSDYDGPVNFKPIVATSISNKAPQDTPAGIVAKKIPDNLNRPLQVGVYTGVKELYLKLEGETIHVTATGNKVNFQGKENSTTLDSKEIFGGEKCISIAPTTKELATACYSTYLKPSIWRV